MIRWRILSPDQFDLHCMIIFLECVSGTRGELRCMLSVFSISPISSHPPSPAFANITSNDQGCFSVFGRKFKEKPLENLQNHIGIRMWEAPRISHQGYGFRIGRTFGSK